MHSSVLFLDLTNVSKMRSIILLLLAQQLSLLVYLQHVPTSEAFGITNRFATQSRTTTSSSFLGQQFRLAQRNNVKANSRCNKAKGSTKLGMFLGSDGGLLGVGTPELAVIVLVGYFLLGPTELFKITKQIGNLFSSIRTIATETSKNFESTMEDQLQLQEIRKAQQDLTDVFNFRTSINSDESAEPGQRKKESPVEIDSSVIGDADVSQGTKKKVRRRRRKVVKKTEDPDVNDIGGVVEDLVMPDTTNVDTENNIPAETEATENLDTSPASWFEDAPSETQPDLEQQQRQQQEENRFQQQLSSQWNDTILQNDDKLSPLSNIMERLAILDEERTATERRLEEEFRERMSILAEEREVRTEMEEEFYAKKRKLLEEAAMEVQTSVFMDSNTNGKNEKNASDDSSTKTAEATTANLSKNASESK